jgi:hypothetical protein
MLEQSLDGAREFRQGGGAGEWHAAGVPASVHTDLRGHRPHPLRLEYESHSAG